MQSMRAFATKSCLVIAFITILSACILGIFLWLNFHSREDSTCRSNAMAGLPIYPRATLVSASDETPNEEAKSGVVLRTYETNDSLGQVTKFYEDLTIQQCQRRQDVTVCLGGNTNLAYQVYISESDEKTIFDLNFGWGCSFD